MLLNSRPTTKNIKNCLYHSQRWQLCYSGINEHQSCFGAVTSVQLRQTMVNSKIASLFNNLTVLFISATSAAIAIPRYSTKSTSTSWATAHNLSFQKWTQASPEPAQRWTEKWRYCRLIICPTISLPTFRMLHHVSSCIWQPPKKVAKQCN